MFLFHNAVLVVLVVGAPTNSNNEFTCEAYWYRGELFKREFLIIFEECFGSEKESFLAFFIKQIIGYCLICGNSTLVGECSLGKSESVRTLYVKTE